MEIKRLQSIIEADFSQKQLEHYTISAFCEQAAISRGLFYYYFHSFGCFLSQCLLRRHELVFQQVEHQTLNSRLYFFLKQIQQNRIFYLNVFHFLKDDYEQLNILLDQLTTYLKRYCAQRGPYSVYTVERISRILFAQIICWLQFGCLQDVKEVHRQCMLVLPIIDQQAHKFPVIEHP